MAISSSSGGGFIGAEVTSTARSLGLEVTVVDPLPVPMSRVLNTEIGGRFVDLHRRHGVRTRFGAGVEAVDGESGDLRVRLTDGTVLEAATVVVGIGGGPPNDGWLTSSGLVIDDGLVCDEYCRSVTAEKNVYAVGDVSRWFHRGGRGGGGAVRTEHWTNAVDQAACVAHNITHPPRSALLRAGRVRMERPARLEDPGRRPDHWSRRPCHCRRPAERQPLCSALHRRRPTVEWRGDRQLATRTDRVQARTAGREQSRELADKARGLDELNEYRGHPATMTSLIWKKRVWTPSDGACLASEMPKSPPNG